MEAVSTDNTLNGWVERLGSRALPAMALTRQRVMQLLDSPNTTHADLQRILSRDPGFTLAIFRLFNALPQPPREPVSNLAHAIALLGIEPTSQADRALPDLHKQLSAGARAALYDCYSRAGHAAWYAYSWGHDLRLGNPEEMAIAALLHDLAEMLLWTYADRQMGQLTALIKDGMPQTDAEEQVFGFSLRHLSLQLAEQWNLPPLTAQALQPVGAFQARSLAVMLASALARETSRDWHSEQSGELIELAAAFNRLEPDPGRAYIHSLVAGVARNLSGLPLPLTVYALLSAPTAGPSGQAVASAPTASAPTQAPLPDPGAMDADTVPIAAAPKPAAPVKRPEKPPAPPTAGASPLQASLSRIFRELRRTAGVERAMFAMLTPDRQALKVKFIVGVEPDSPLEKFQHPVGERHLLTLLLKKNQSIWLQESNREKLLPLMGEALRTTLDTRGFFMSSLFIKNRPIGILYADRVDDILLDIQGFNHFKSLTQRLCNELSRKT
ncbi:HDOD domain-containing protein [Sedimenticola hydrogenitrophicus]|uniref:HDOD domain-containing protein n=1 Tax=Sedimenticola hydrogenitrophicus TaxID=2967975 RepID=UPI0021A5BC42|nr:HDOD domain-containing protein [Sedimenticola hydrogenitrophicus]